jgi:hypothetical protein
MKRDLDLVRKILLMSEDAPGRIDEVKLAALDDDADKLAFHVQLMAEHGLIVGSVTYDGFRTRPLSIEVHRVTWQGFDYLDAIRSPKVWDKAKRVIAESVGETSLSVVKQTCQAIAWQMIQQQIGL